jgi:hypothetical protein
MGGRGVQVAQVREFAPVAYLMSPAMHTRDRNDQFVGAAHHDEASFSIGGRFVLHLVLAAVPLLAISAQVFGLFSMRSATALIVIPLAVLVILISVFAFRASDRIIVSGFLWGVVACIVYDAFRLDTVYMLGWWDDFIPRMGSWITGGEPGSWAGAVVGYGWRYIGDGGGIGITFFVLAVAFGLGRRTRTDAVLAAVAFAVFPVWTGLIATVAFAPRGQEMMFPLTVTTVTLSLIGHLIFGVVLGLGFWRARAVQHLWPWPPIGRETLSALATSTGRRRMRTAAALIPEQTRRRVSPGTYEEWQRELASRRTLHRRARRENRERATT